MHTLKAYFLRLSIILAIAASYTIFCPVTTTHAKGKKWQEGARLSVRAVIAPFTFIKLSTDSIVFNVSGEPGEYIADKNVEVTVGSNSSSWAVEAVATPLIGENGEIPANQLYIKKKGGKDYTDMGSEILLAEGSQTSPTVTSDLSFKLKTTWENRAGTYDGEIMFIYLAIP
ncbi:MAG: hypothetical protein HON76_10550 [Candidatus Scalindua sp.]|jgi:hypothetical protein|nr:hypothetical protein [Candidatus Scalindua sp.]MBT5304031.1 hypothetical protein [Candidatus Scalindua sp.]MBT6228015.1 hypothetical protein [Candidatus Scalindua sp.]MBT6562953.1 hypothetical protein [Candidatus Scalindua sp.]MBT7211147.1 hypothetical protein [Candidatus Scalindua sp.]